MGGKGRISSGEGSQSQVQVHLCFLSKGFLFPCQQAVAAMFAAPCHWTGQLSIQGTPLAPSSKEDTRLWTRPPGHGGGPDELLP